MNDTPLKRFYFQGINPEGQKISGSLFAENQEEARAKLRKKGLAILSLDEYTADHEEKTNDRFQKFEFEGTDKNGKPARGKIEAVNDYAAFKKLIREYGFTLTALFPENISENEKQAHRQQGIPPYLKEQYQEEFGMAHNEEIKPPKNLSRSKKKSVLSEKDQLELQFFQTKIGEIIDEVNHLIQENKSILRAEQRREMEDRINLLSRLRRSNAIDHLKTLTKKIFDQLRDDSIFLSEEKLNEDQQLEMAAQKKAFLIRANEIGKEFRAGLAGVAINLTSLHPEKIKQEFQKADPFGKLGLVLYWMVVSLFGLCTVFWIFSALQLWNASQVPRVLFSLESTVLWIITGATAFLSVIFFPAVFSPKPLSWRQRSVFFLLAVGGVAVLVFESPALFPWTR